MKKIQLRKNITRLLSPLLCAAFVFSLAYVPETYAADSLASLNQQYRDLEKKVSDREKKLAAISSDRSKNETKITELRAQISDLEEQKSVLNKRMDLLNADIKIAEQKIAEIDAEIVAKQAQILQLNNDIQQREQSIADAISLLSDRLRANYMTGNVSTLEILLTAEDFSSFLTRSELVARIAAHDHTLITELEKEMVEIENIRLQVEEEKAVVEERRREAAQESLALQKTKAELQANMDTVSAKENDITRKTNNIVQIVDGLDKNSALYQQEIAVAEQEMREMDSKINAIIENSGSSQKPDDNNGGSSGGSTPIPTADGTFPLPYSLNQVYMSSCFGTNVALGQMRDHKGVDLCVYGGSQGRRIVAYKGGRVILSSYGYNGGYGNYIIIDHGNGLHTLYAHCSSLLVSQGQSVKEGQDIAKVGATGRVSGPHLHFEVRINRNGSSVQVNPMPNYIPWVTYNG